MSGATKSGEMVEATSVDIIAPGKFVGTYYPTSRKCRVRIFPLDPVGDQHGHVEPLLGIEYTRIDSAGNAIGPLKSGRMVRLSPIIGDGGRRWVRGNLNDVAYRKDRKALPPSGAPYFTEPECQIQYNERLPLKQMTWTDDLDSVPVMEVLQTE